MKIRVLRWRIAPMVILAILGMTVGVSASSGPRLVDITTTAKGQGLVAAAAPRHRALGVGGTSPLRAWQTAPGQYLVGRRLPVNFSTSVVTGRDGKTRISMTYDVGVGGAPAASPRAAGILASGPSWFWLDQDCFTRVGDDDFGYIDACFSIHRLRNESHNRDFYKLEQFGTVGAGFFRKIYDGFMSAARSSTSAAMSWVDWSPRGDLSGSCQTIPLSVSALGISISASGVMCERWDITKFSAAGKFKEQWSCGCIFPFGQPWPNDREIDYMQAVSVPNGGAAIWTLSAGYTAA